MIDNKEYGKDDHENKNMNVNMIFFYALMHKGDI